MNGSHARVGSNDGSKFLEVDTALGRLVASSLFGEGDPACIEISLEKPDGTSGQVTRVVVNPELQEELGECPLQTFAWDGNDPEYAECVECDPNGHAMQHPGWSHGAPERYADRGCGDLGQMSVPTSLRAALETIARDVIERDFVDSGAIESDEASRAVEAFCDYYEFADDSWEEGLRAAFESVVSDRDQDEPNVQSAIVAADIDNLRLEGVRASIGGDFDR